MTPESTVAVGTISRGKYTFVIRFALPTRLFDDCVSAFEKKVHGTSAASVNSGYGTPSDGTCARRPKNTLNTSIVRNGWRSEERRVGKECRSRWSAYQQKKKMKTNTTNSEMMRLDNRYTYGNK